MKTIKIGDEEYKVKYSIRSLFIFEAITKKQFKIETLLDNYIFFYSMILASNPDKKTLDWDVFLDALDENPKLFQQMQEVVAEEQKKNDLIFVEEDSKKKVKD